MPPAPRGRGSRALPHVKPMKSQPATRNDALDGLRAIAALGVLTFHSWLYRIGDPPGPRRSVGDHLLFQGNLGLICFFVLSGYLLYRPFARAALTGRRVALGAYARRRIARIVPAYYACVAGCVLLFAAIGYTDVLPAAGKLPLFAVFGENYSMDTLMKIDPVLWTLCVEAAFYVLLPFLGLVAFLLGPRRVGPQAGFLCALIGMTAVWNSVVHSKGLGPIASKSLIAYLGHFAFGMLVAMWVERRRLSGTPRDLGARASAILMIAGIGIVALNAVAYETLSADSFERSVLAKLPTALGFALVIAAAAAGSGAAVRWLRWRPLVGVGVISYGVYLWHLPLLLAVRKLGLLPASLGPRWVVVLALALGAAALSWFGLEKPMIERAARPKSGRRAPALAGAEAQAAP